MQSTQHGQRVGEVLEWSKGRVEVCRLQLNISEQTLNAKRNGHTLVTFFLICYPISQKEKLLQVTNVSLKIFVENLFDISMNLYIMNGLRRMKKTRSDPNTPDRPQRFTTPIWRLQAP